MANPARQAGHGTVPYVTEKGMMATDQFYRFFLNGSEVRIIGYEPDRKIWVKDLKTGMARLVTRDELESVSKD